MYEIGTSPYFSNVAPGEVPDLPSESTPQSAGYEESTDESESKPLLNPGQQVEYPPYDPDEEQIEIQPLQYQPDNGEVVLVEDTDINVDGESTKYVTAM